MVFSGIIIFGYTAQQPGFDRGIRLTCDVNPSTNALHDDNNDLDTFINSSFVYYLDKNPGPPASYGRVRFRYVPNFALAQTDNPPVLHVYLGNGVWKTIALS